MSRKNKHKKEPTKPQVSAEKNSKRNNLLFSFYKKPISWIISCVGIVSLYLALQPNISVSPLESLDSKQPFQTPFLIHNESIIPLYNVSTTMEIDSIKSAPMETRFYQIALRDSLIINKIPPRDKSTFFCCFPFDTLSSHLTEADMYIRIKYNLFWNNKCHEKWFHFIAKIDVNNKLHWLQYPINNDAQKGPEYKEIVCKFPRKPSNQP